MIKLKSLLVENPDSLLDLPGGVVHYNSPEVYPAGYNRSENLLYIGQESTTHYSVKHKYDVAVRIYFKQKVLTFWESAKKDDVVNMFGCLERMGKITNRNEWKINIWRSKTFKTATEVYISFDKFMSIGSFYANDYKQEKIEKYGSNRNYYGD